MKEKPKKTYEKPVKLDMPFNEAMERLTKVSKEDIEREMKKEENKLREAKNFKHKNKLP